MSAYSNSNYGVPPMGLVNGGVAPQQTPPAMVQQQQQQPQSQQLQFTPQHQQQILLQKQQAQQQHVSPGPALNNMSMSIGKFMPPAVPGSFAAVSPMTGAAATNGPRMTGAQPNSAPPGMANNLPPHMRAPGMLPNGPHGVAAPLTNGGSGGAGASASANSSRTASPALQAVPQQQQTQPQQFLQKVPLPIASSSFGSGPVTSSAGAGSLSGSMQNLSFNSRANGAAPVQQQPQTTHLPPAGSVIATQLAPQLQQQQKPQQQHFPVNFQGNFKASALNAGAVVQAPTRPYPPQPAVMFGTSTQVPTTSFAPHGAQPQPQSQPPQNTNYPLLMPGSVGMAPLPPNAARQQNQLNNNQQQQQQQPPQQQYPQRKPMYPTNAQQTQLLQQQQQQQQAYTQSYQHQQQSPPPPPGMFNGQGSNAPLQYQSAQPPQQHLAPGAPNSPYNPPLSVTQQGFSHLWGQDTIDLMQNRHILTPATLALPKIVLHNQFHESINCSPNIMRCTVTKIPESNSLLQKSRLPLGILIHPFRDINSLPVIQCPSIVRCRLCRTYINPFVYFVDSKMWKCNLCYRVNELPEDFQFDPATKTYGDVTRRPEVRSSTIEFIAPSEYMLRPPQPAIYLFLLDVSIFAQQSGYLENACAVLSAHLDDMPGDARMQIGFIAYNSEVHFYSMADGYNQPHEMTLLDIDDPFLPRPDNLLVNLKECKELVKDLLMQLPKRFADTHDPGSAMGSALQVAFKLMQSSGGRVTVFQSCLPNKGPGSLGPREDPNNRSAKDVAHLNPATDFYKRYALECSGYQIAVDLFLLNQQYSDLATISGVSKHSGGCLHHFPLYQKTKVQQVDSFKQCFQRYLTRKIGLESVMRIRCTRGLQVHTFHGNFFVRSTDLLSLPNVNPDAGYGMQISYEETLTDVKTICFQAALLYTNSDGERRIRVHTLCLPVTASLAEVMHSADSEAIIGLLSKMAVDRSIGSNVADAREAFINATVDILSAFKIAQNLPSGETGQLIAPRSLALLPLYILALLKSAAFRVGTSTRLDDRVYAMDCMKTMPLDQLIRYIYPEFYRIDELFYHVQESNANANSTDEEDDDDLPELTRLQLSAEHLDSRSIFLIDCGTLIMLYVGLNVPAHILENTLGVKSTAELPDYSYGLPNVNSVENDALKRFIMRLNDEKPYAPILQIIRDTSTAKPQFMERLVDDRSESSLSYYEFLQHIRSQVK